jgi:hypothetical protein
MGSVHLKWSPLDLTDPGPIIEVTVMNSPDVLSAWRTDGLECPAPVRMKALLDTGASVTVISKVYANYCKLLQTSEGSKVTAIGAEHHCWEHAGAISFPGTDLRPFESIRIRSVVFEKEPYYAILIGRDILRNWTITFDGRHRLVTIVD